MGATLKKNSTTVSTPKQQVSPKELADRVPFILRAWWLKDYDREERHQFFEDASLLTLPLWSLHSDPKCDAASVDIDLL